MTLSAILLNPYSGEEIIVNVLLDSGSSITLLTESLADKLNLKGWSSPLQLSGVGNSSTKYESKNVDVGIKSLDTRDKYILNDVQVIPKITGNLAIKDWRPFLSKYGIEGHAPSPSKTIDILIGWKPNPYLLVHKECIAVDERVLILRTILGWSVCGVARRVTETDNIVKFTFDDDLFTTHQTLLHFFSESPSDNTVGESNLTEENFDSKIEEITQVTGTESPSDNIVVGSKEDGFPSSLRTSDLWVYRTAFNCSPHPKYGERVKCRFRNFHDESKQPPNKRFQRRYDLKYVHSTEDAQEDDFECTHESIISTESSKISYEESTVSDVVGDVAVLPHEDRADGISHAGVEDPAQVELVSDTSNDSTMEEQTNVIDKPLTPSPVQPFKVQVDGGGDIDLDDIEVIYGIDDISAKDDNKEELSVHANSGDDEFMREFTTITSQLLAEKEDTPTESKEETVQTPSPHSDPTFCMAANPENPATQAQIKELIDLVQKSTVYDNYAEDGKSWEDNRCIDILKKTYQVIKDPDGTPHVEVSPLWKPGQPSNFNTNYAYAKKRLENIHKDMPQEHFDCIDKIFEEYISKHKVAIDITEEVKDPYNEDAIWWAHFPVLNPNSTSTPVRPVMDGRCPCLGYAPKKSINNHCFSPGPCLICDLVDVTLRYRKHDIAFTGDVSKMFLKVRVPPKDQKYMRFMWYKKDRKTLRYFQFTGHVFGKVCSPTCALFATQNNARNHADRMARAAESVCKSTLVDDTLDSVTTWQEARQVILDLIEMHKAIGLEISKFATNSLELSENLPDYVKKSEDLIFFERAYGPQYMEYAPGTVPKMPRIRALGQYHNLHTDTFGYKTGGYTPDENTVWTKQACLSQAMKVYDPLGFASPIMLKPKLLIQELWRVVPQMKWTTALSPSQEETWKAWLPNLPKLEKLEYPRVLIPGLETEWDTIQLHVFSDASAQAFASVGYVRVTYKDNIKPTYVNFAGAKNNIAPIKTKRTIPKLELMSIEQGSRLATKISDSLEIPKCDIYLWSDAKTALQWLRMDSSTLMLLIHNYCNKIKARFDIKQIRWVPGTENPADIATRPINVDDLVKNPLWSQGPEWLKKDPSTWPTLVELDSTTPNVMEGVKKDYKLFSKCFSVVPKKPEKSKPKVPTSPGSLELERLSSFPKAIRVSARVMRYITYIREKLKQKKLGDPQDVILQSSLEKLHADNLTRMKQLPLYSWSNPLRKGQKRSINDPISFSYIKVPYDPSSLTSFIPPHSRITGTELKEAELRLIHEHQQKYFADEIKRIQSGQDLLVNSKLRRLGAFMGTTQSIYGKEFNFDLLRLNGRIGYAKHLQPDMKHPYVLHPDDPFVTKIVRHYHADVLQHMGGIKCLTCELNRSKWVVGSIAKLKNVINSCVTCRKANPRPTIQQMAPLPSFRIPGDRENRPAPFTVTALDAAGPWYTSEGRGLKIKKRWLLIFRCAKYGAVYLDVLWGMSTDDFLQALTRFISQHTKPLKIVCDNGTNFVGGDKELNWKEFWSDVNIDDVRDKRPDIEFSFSPAYAPHFNGLVERMIKEVKRNISHLFSSTLTLQELHTCFKEVQRVLNNRPIDLKYGRKDPLDLEPLTPAHFLCSGGIHEELTSPENEPSNTLASKYWSLQKRLDEFWTRFVQTMTPHLRGYNKWITKRPEISVGDVVCLLEISSQDDTNPKKRYKLGLVTAVLEGIDDTPRRVKLRLANGSEIERALNRIYVIVPVNERETVGSKLRRSKRRKRKPEKYQALYTLDSSCSFWPSDFDLPSD